MGKWELGVQRAIVFPVSKLLSMIIFFICDRLQHTWDGWYSELCCRHLLLSFHPLQWVRCSFVAFATFDPCFHSRSCRCMTHVCHVVSPLSHYSSVCLLARHRGVSVSHRAVFVEWFVIIRRPPLGNAPRHLCKYMLLHPPLNLFFWSYASSRTTGNTRVMK